MISTLKYVTWLYQTGKTPGGGNSTVILVQMCRKDFSNGPYSCIHTSFQKCIHIHVLVI